MLFTSFNFIIFLLITFILYYALPKKFQWMVLLVASYVFYIIQGPTYVPFIVVTTISAYVLAIKMSEIQEAQKKYFAENKATLTRDDKRAYKAVSQKKKKQYMLIALLINIGILAIVKYTNFVIFNINVVTDTLNSGVELSYVSLIVPLGISFYTFQTVSYVLDIYNNRYLPERNLGKFALFVSFFPQLVQGPISRYNDLSQTLFDEHKWDNKTISFGLQRILWGFFKKLVIADRMLIAVNTIIDSPETYTGFYVFLGMMFYALQLYADFSGGIDITIGVAQIFGVKMKENFIRPYFSKNIKEYWNRWHITMGTWFTDYIFYPVSISAPLLKLSKFSRNKFGDKIGKRVPVYAAAFMVWLTTGIWHGASWNFIVWGLTNCAVILISQELEPCYEWFHSKFNVAHKTSYRAFQVIRTVLLMSCIRTFDCYRDVPLTFKMFGTMFTDWNVVQVLSGGILELGLEAQDFVILVIGTAILILVSLKQRRGSVRAYIAAKPYALKMCVWYGMFLAILIFGIYGIGFEQSQFIYNQF